MKLPSFSSLKNIIDIHKKQTILTSTLICICISKITCRNRMQGKTCYYLDMPQAYIQNTQQIQHKPHSKEKRK